MPACATPVAEGMKIFTKSARAIGAQRATMDPVINHPLDCPICDQGASASCRIWPSLRPHIARFTERKRVVPDENLGPLIATDMTAASIARAAFVHRRDRRMQELGMIAAAGR